MPKASTNRMIYNANYNKVGQCIYNKDLWNRPLLDFEWNRFHICQYFKKRSYMLYILISYLFAYLLQLYVYINENLLFSNALSLKLLELLLFQGKRDIENKQLLFAIKRYIFFLCNIRSGAFFLYYNEQLILLILSYNKNK